LRLAKSPLEPLRHRRVRVRLLLGSYLDAVTGGTPQGRPEPQAGSRLLLHNIEMWPYGSYNRLQKALDDLRTNYRHGVYNCLRSVYVVGRTRTLDSHASRLRQRLGEATETPYVLNIWGVGRGMAGTVGEWREVA
jgi:hypothetical protein